LSHLQFWTVDANSDSLEMSARFTAGMLARNTATR
jgi:hypothetical protein